MAKIKELRGLIYSHCDSESQFARELGWPKQKLNKITNGIKEPDIFEIEKISETLGVSHETISQIFLRYWSPIRQQKERGRAG